MKAINPRLIVIGGSYAVKADYIITADNPVVADSIGTPLMGFQESDINHIRVAEKEGLGTTALKNFRFNQNWKEFQLDFSVNRTFIDSLSTLLFNSECRARIVMDSPFKPLIYQITK